MWEERRTVRDGAGQEVKRKGMRKHREEIKGHKENNKEEAR